MIEGIFLSSDICFGVYSRAMPKTKATAEKRAMVAVEPVVDSETPELGLVEPELLAVFPPVCCELALDAVGVFGAPGVTLGIEAFVVKTRR